MRKNPLPLLAALLTSTLPGPLAAQRVEGAVSLARFVSAGEGIERHCLEPGYRTTVGGRVAARVLTGFTLVALSARAPVISNPSTCVDGFPPPDGTYEIEERTNLLAARYLGTDLRLEARDPEKLGDASVAIGIGNTWRGGLNMPYLLLAAGLALNAGTRLRAGVEAEWQHLRVSADRYRRTYQNFSLVEEVSLGRVHRWSNALTVGIFLGFAI